jgi:hypothetical protein
MHPTECLREDKFESIDEKLERIETNTTLLLQHRWKAAGMSMLAGIIISIVSFAATMLLAFEKLKAFVK